MKDRNKKDNTSGGGVSFQQFYKYCVELAVMQHRVQQKPFSGFEFSSQNPVGQLHNNDNNAGLGGDPGLPTCSLASRLTIDP